MVLWFLFLVIFVSEKEREWGARREQGEGEEERTQSCVGREVGRI